MIFFLKITFKNTYLFLTNRYYRQFVFLTIFYGDNKRYSRKKISFLKYSFDVPDPMSFIWQFKEIFVDGYYDFKTEKNKPVIYDCGANIGTSCLFFKTIYPNAVIKAFEADPQIASILESNLKRNKIEDVEVINKAVWINTEGINISPEGSDAASIYTEGKKISVESVRLRDLLAKETSVDMLKIDIEGAEMEVILDCAEVLSKAENIFIEYHSFVKYPQNLQDILGILTKNNFRYSIISILNRRQPFINKGSKNNQDMDMQVNIFAYKAK